MKEFDHTGLLLAEYHAAEEIYDTGLTLEEYLVPLRI